MGNRDWGKGKAKEERSTFSGTELEMGKGPSPL